MDWKYRYFSEEQKKEPMELRRKDAPACADFGAVHNYTCIVREGCKNSKCRIKRNCALYGKDIKLFAD